MTQTANTVLKLGTRTSPLAMWQANFVRLLLASSYPTLQVSLVPITTTGDTDQRAFSQINDRGLFAKELEQALLEGRIDCAVHSAKDLRLEEADGLAIAAVMTREDPHDALVGTRSIADLQPGDTVATGSSRRKAQLLSLRPDLQVEDIRGNVQTRLKRFRERANSACILAAAGLKRLGLAPEIGQLLPLDQFVPEAGQGAIAVQVRSGELENDVQSLDWSRLADKQATWAFSVERGVAYLLGGGCTTPIGVHVEHAKNSIHLFAASPDGSEFRRASLPINTAANVDMAVMSTMEAAREAGVLEVVEGGSA